MKLKDVMGKLSQNKRNGQLVTCIKKNKLKTIGISNKDLFNMNIDLKMKKIFKE